ncbi:UNVERIFIED_CONTAM: putative mitochondrial protein [Sesamum latifolium]|uniref:Mitochondrial protein n=1 Tax=Sesamum latifolium TaxID=2727402 RepID=A0AAW2V1V9_9LAMI
MWWSGLPHTGFSALLAGLFVVGRLLSTKSFHLDALHSTLKAAFNPVRGNRLGKFKEVDLDKNGEAWGSFLRVRVALDITKPLKRALKLHTILGDEQLISFSYERLPNFYYFYGCLGHLSRQCEFQFQEGFRDPGDSPPYDPWLRVVAPSNFRCRSGSFPLKVSTDSLSRPTFLPRSSLQIPDTTPVSIPPRTHISDLNLIPPAPISLDPSSSLDPPPLSHTNNPVPPPPPSDSPKSDCCPHPTLAPIPLNPCMVFTAHSPTDHTTHLPQPSRPSPLKRTPHSQPKKALSRKRHLVDDNSGDEIENQGPRGPWIVQHLGQLVRANNPSLVFLSENKGSCRLIDFLKRKFDMYGFGVPSKGRSGGLAVPWIKSVNVQLQNFSSNHIDISSGRAWLCARDYNEILDQSEKSGGPPRPNWQIRNFRWALEDCGLSNIGFSGSSFTWSNRHLHPHIVLERLDRACANAGWSVLFPDAVVSHIPVNCSDHKALLIRLADSLGIESLAIFEETKWRQRSKDLWLREGDRNLSYFHRRASQRFKTNSIRKIRSPGGQWVMTMEGIQRCIVSYFREVFESSRPVQENIAKGMEFLPRVVDAIMSEILLQPSTAIEVSNALFQMAPKKSPGPDGGLGWMALKLDVSKAYDKVEWPFLEQSFGSLVPQWGLRQGDPLSPYLFLLCTESFSSLLQNAERTGGLRGLSVCRGAPSISHLLFADDTLIFCQASHECTLAIKEVLEVYRKASVQDINFSKSSVAFSRNTREELCVGVATELSIRRENKIELYLGLPSRIARSKRELFATIRDRIWSKIAGWNEKLLSQTGKEILKKPEKLLSQVLKARYFPTGDIFSAGGGRRPSFTWRSLMAAQYLFRAGCRWRVGLGDHIRVWYDPWLPRPRSFRPITSIPVSDSNMRVSELRDPASGEWNERRVRELFWPIDSKLILGIPAMSCWLGGFVGVALCKKWLVLCLKRLSHCSRARGSTMFELSGCGGVVVVEEGLAGFTPE